MHRRCPCVVPPPSPGDEIVQILESTPLDDASEFEIDSDFMPILKEVMGKVPNVILEGAAAADRDVDRIDERQLQEPSAASAPIDAAPLSATAAAASFSEPERAGRGGEVSFSRRPVSSSEGEAGRMSDEAAQDGLPDIKLDDETLVAVSRAIMGRLDVVDLVGKETAYEAAERVREGEGGPG